VSSLWGGDFPFLVYSESIWLKEGFHFWILSFAHKVIYK
jgi:hypothetical protein